MRIPSKSIVAVQAQRVENTDLQANIVFKRSSGICNNLDHCRSWSDVFWSSLTVLIVCVWVSVHPNVSGRRDSSATIFWRKMGLMAFSLMFPELMVWWATQQWYAARKLCERYRDKGWTKTHAFFSIMGGFALYDGEEFIAIIRPSQPLALGLDGQGATLVENAESIGRIPEREINDHSSSDGLSKLVVVLQTTWFITQLLARWVQDLPATEIEIMTLGFAILNVIIYFLWWYKPQGVDCYIRVQRSHSGSSRACEASKEFDSIQAKEPEDLESPLDTLETTTRAESPRTPYPKSWSTNGAKAWYQTFFEPEGTYALLSASVPFKQALLILGYLLFAPLTPAIEILLRPWRDVRTFSRERIPSFEDAGQDLAPPRKLDRFFTGTVAAAFGAVHCIAWHLEFPSEQEKNLWISSSLIVSLVPVGMVVTMEGSHFGSRIALVVYSLTYSFALIAYTMARLYLILESFLALRDLPQGALETVQWTNFIPHI
ncbi:hypothetical protein GYMLUDRAFT_150206 [Collybiopsis luxurians FD-317 M1]|nr:hypothetical protein GYMLUDRAFT_150206 [Collybiopsis luxurians FD-317 M1]